MGKLKFAYAEIEYDGSGESIIREIGQIFTRAIAEPATGHTDPLNAMNVLNGRMAASGLPAPVSDSPSPASRGNTAAADLLPPAAGPEHSGEQRRGARSCPRGRPPKKAATQRQLPAGDAADFDADDPPVKRGALADKIAEQIGKYGKLSRMQLAMKLLKSEKAIGIAIGQAGTRFKKDDDGFFHLNE